MTSHLEQRLAQTQRLTDIIIDLTEEFATTIKGTAKTDQAQFEKSARIVGALVTAANNAMALEDKVRARLDAENEKAAQIEGTANESTLNDEDDLTETDIADIMQAAVRHLHVYHAADSARPDDRDDPQDGASEC